MNKNIDILKYVMSIMIIMIHVGGYTNLVFLRCAVPIFFIISSYFFFEKINNSPSSKAHSIYIKFVKRSTTLYIFWFIVLLPYMLTLHIMNNDLLQFIRYLPYNIFLRSTFPASWYIAAYIIGITIIYKFKNHNWLMFIFSILCYILCCMETNYANYSYHIPYFKYLIGGGNNILSTYLRNIYISFPAGMIFIWIGKLISEHKRVIRLNFGIIGIIIGGFFLYVENKFILENSIRQSDDCFLSLILLSPSIFIFILSLPQILTYNSLTLRKMSTIYYCSHIIIIRITHRLFFSTNDNKFLLLICTIVTCTIISLLLINLASSNRMKFLKYSY